MDIEIVTGAEFRRRLLRLVDQVNAGEARHTTGVERKRVEAILDKLPEGSVTFYDDADVRDDKRAYCMGRVKDGKLTVSYKTYGDLTDMDDKTRELLRERKAALAPLIRHEGVEAVVWCERGPLQDNAFFEENASYFTLTKKRRDPANYEERLHAETGRQSWDILLDAPGADRWCAIAQSAFKLQEAASAAFGVEHIDVQMEGLRCRAETAADRNRTQVMAAVVMSHPIIKSFGRMARGAIKRVMKADESAKKREQPQPRPEPQGQHQDSL